MENEFDTTENTIKFFDRFFAYDLLDHYPNHKIAAEADYSLRLLWSVEKVCIRDWAFSGERIRAILYDELTIEILLNAIGAYKIYCTTPWYLSIIILAMLTICKYNQDLLEPIKMNELRSQSMICFAGSGFLDYANAKTKRISFRMRKENSFLFPSASSVSVYRRAKFWCMRICSTARS